MQLLAATSEKEKTFLIPKVRAKWCAYRNSAVQFREAIIQVQNSKNYLLESSEEQMSCLSSKYLSLSFLYQRYSSANFQRIDMVFH